MHDTRDFPAKISQSAGIESQKDSGLLPNLPWAIMDPDAPRLTRKFQFTWNLNTKTLRVNKWEGEHRQAEWVGLKQKAQELRQMDKQAQGSDPVASRDRVGPSRDMLDPPSLEDDFSDSSFSSSCAEEGDDLLLTPTSPRTSDGDSREVVSSEWVDLALPEHVFGKIVVAEPPSFSDSQFELGESSHRLANSKETEGWLSLSLVLVDDNGGDAVSPLQCVPIAMVMPSRAMHGTEESISEPFQWVKRRHQGFCKLVGFPIESHEQECLALLQRIEAERFTKKPASVPRRNQASGIKGK